MGKNLCEKTFAPKKEVIMINANQVKFGEFIFTTGEIYLQFAELICGNWKMF